MLGCVVVTDCLSQAEYRERYPDSVEENESEYLWMCERPARLLVPLAAKGGHRLCTLPQPWSSARMFTADPRRHAVCMCAACVGKLDKQTWAAAQAGLVVSRPRPTAARQ